MTLFFEASVIWGLVGPKWIFGPLGNYGNSKRVLLGGYGPVCRVWLCTRHSDRYRGFLSFNFPRYRKIVVEKVTIILSSAALDAGVAFFWAWGLVACRRATGGGGGVLGGRGQEVPGDRAPVIHR
ncbi:hypothetical protein Tco_1259384 [Tanacetum coccineum]